MQNEIKRAVRHGLSALAGVLGAVGVSQAQVEGLESAIVPIVASLASFGWSWILSKAASKLRF